MNSQTVTKTKTTINYSINFFKGIACICVVLIHARFPGWFGELVVSLSRSAVAFFFVVAGYFSFYKNQDRCRIKIIKKIHDTADLCLFSILFYLIWGIAVRWIGTGSSSVLEWFSDLSCWESISSFIFLQNDIFAGHLWFLFALLICYIAFYFINKYDLYATSTFISIAMLLVMLIITNVLPNMGIVINISTRNAWFYGIPVFILSNRMHMVVDKCNIRRIKNWNFIIAVLLLSCFIMFERILCGYSQLYLGNLCFVTLVFLYAVQNPTLLYQKQICFIGEHCSTNIYIFHWAIINIIQKVASILCVTDTDIYLWVFPVITVITSIVAALVLFYIAEFFKRKQ